MTSEPKNRLGTMRDRLPRIVALRVAGEMLGQGALADALAIEPRSLRAKIGADRGISNEELSAAAAAVEARAQKLLEHGRRLRDLAGEAS